MCFTYSCLSAANVKVRAIDKAAKAAGPTECSWAWEQTIAEAQAFCADGKTATQTVPVTPQGVKEMDSRLVVQLGEKIGR